MLALAPLAYQWWTFIHILGVAGFLFAHGASGIVSFRLRKERDRRKIETLLQLSGAAVPAMYVSLLVLVAGGVGAGIVLHSFQQKWIWTAIGLLVLITIAMLALSSPYYRKVKEGVKLRPSGVPRKSDEELDELLRSTPPMVSMAIGILGLAAIIYLMVMKPF